MRFVLRWTFVWLSFFGCIWILYLFSMPVGHLKSLRSGWLTHKEENLQFRKLRFSPSGKYLLILCEGIGRRDQGSIAQVIDVDTDQVVLHEKHFSNTNHVFTENDQLLYATAFGNKLNLMSWNPGQEHPVCRCVVPVCLDPGYFEDEDTLRINDKSENEAYSSLISDDGKRWLVFEDKPSSIELGLYDTATGLRLSSYPMKGVNRTVDAFFHSASNTLILHRSNEEQSQLQNAVDIQWVNASDGKLQQTVKLGPSTELGRILHMDIEAKTIYAMGNGNSLQMLSPSGQYTALLLRETVHDMV